MTFREEIVIRILLIVAKMFADEPSLSQEITNLRNHIQTNGRK